ncbi:MAG: hypothetical protein P1U89_03380 [Verrucomicrobiales bacterium]|nr:hypothetical protein [Verrucomicrobiales bacterium]
MRFIRFLFYNLKIHIIVRRPLPLSTLLIMATRYSDKTKKEVVEFVKKYDAEHGRGGQSAAKKQFKINPISIKKWCVDQGYTTGPSKKKAAAKPAAKPKAAPAKAGAKKGVRRGRKPAAATTTAAAKSAAAPVSSGSMTAKLKKMSDISEKIEALQAEFDALKKSL